MEPATVVIAGRSAALNGVDSIQISGEKVNIDELNQDLNVAIKLKEFLPDGTALADNKGDGKVVVSVAIEPLVTQNVGLPKGQITISDIPQGYVAEFVTDDEMINFEIVGLEEVIGNLDISLVTGNISIKTYMQENRITDINKGILVVPVTLNLPEGITLKAPLNISVKFREE